MGRILLTGATGFVGGRLAARLRARGDEVIAVVRSPSDALDALDVDQRMVSLTDVESLTHAGQGAGVLVHAAATTDPRTAEQVNVAATHAVCGAAQRLGAHLVHVSTCSVYDRARAISPIAEDAPRVGTSSPDRAPSAYAATKARAEDAVADAAPDGLTATVLRPPAVLGAGSSSTWGTRVPRRFATGQGPAIADASTFGFVHVDDLVDALVAAVDGSRTPVGGAVAGPAAMSLNVVGGHVTFGDYRARLAEFLPGAPAAGSPSPLWDGTYDDTRLPARLSVHPHRSFDDAMAEIAASWADGDPGHRANLP